MVDLAFYAIFGFVLLSWLLLFLARRPRSQKVRKPVAVLDGSNVMHWRDGTPHLATVISVLRRIEQSGLQAGVIFDANAGYLLGGRYMNDGHFARQLGLGADRVMVVPKGEQADPFLLRFATENDALVVSNDRFRDRIDDFPQMSAPGRLIRGGFRDGRSGWIPTRPNWR